MPNLPWVMLRPRSGVLGLAAGNAPLASERFRFGFARRFARKGREIALVSAGWDNANVVPPDGYGQAQGVEGRILPPPWGKR
jgi:hypothetical protein